MTEFQVILDANFLMTPGLYGVDIFSELDRLLDVNYELIIPSAVIRELKYLASKGTASESSAARIALELSSRADIIETCECADEEILRLAKKEEGYIVCTNDKDLRDKLRANKVPVIYLRQRSYLALVGSV